MIKFKKESAQDKQDEIFRRMSADQKIELASQLWLLAKEIDSDKIDYGRNRSATSSRKDRGASQ